MNSFDKWAHDVKLDTGRVFYFHDMKEAYKAGMLKAAKIAEEFETYKLDLTEIKDGIREESGSIK